VVCVSSNRWVGGMALGRRVCAATRHPKLKMSLTCVQLLFWESKRAKQKMAVVPPFKESTLWVSFGPLLRKPQKSQSDGGGVARTYNLLYRKLVSGWEAAMWSLPKRAVRWYATFGELNESHWASRTAPWLSLTCLLHVKPFSFIFKVKYFFHFLNWSPLSRGERRRFSYRPRFGAVDNRYVQGCRGCCHLQRWSFELRGVRVEGKEG